MIIDDKPTDFASLQVALVGFKSTVRNPEPAGIYFEARQVRDLLSLGRDCSYVLGPNYLKLLQDGGSSADSSDADNAASEDNWLDPDDQAYSAYLKRLDPTACKDQDHYKVLGLSKLRYQATDNQIKIAYRKKVLHHHPDKRRHKGQIVKVGEEDYFTCISRAYDTLSVSQKRRAYDSVDPLFDDATPSSATKENFYKTFEPVFKRNERWSKVEQCPTLGNAETDFTQVDRFYQFWYNFDSWREFSYLDEEDKEKGENRDERRWIEKQNRALRDKRRKDEVKRIRTLVDNAYKCDPRVAQRREDEKRRKEQEKLAKEETRRAKVESEERKRREEAESEKRERDMQEDARRQQQLSEKREKENAKKLLQKERKSLQEFCQKADYFCAADDSMQRVSNMADVDRLCQLLSFEQLQSLNSELAAATNGMKPLDVFRKFVDRLNEHLENEKRKLMDIALGISSAKDGDSSCRANWTPEETQLLIKGTTLFPVGTKSRWNVIAAFINEHLKTNENESAKKTEKDVVAKVKELQKTDDKSRESVVKGVPLLQVKSNAQVETAPSVRMDGCTDEASAWSSEEQKLLEQALKTYPTTQADRWDKIAECLPGRTKKDCVKRYKEIAELVRARKVALQQQEATNRTKS